MHESSRRSQFYEGRLDLLHRIESRYYERNGVFANQRIPVIQANHIPRRAPTYVSKNVVTNNNENIEGKNETGLRKRWQEARQDAQQKQGIVYFPTMPKVINMHGHTTKGIPFQRYVDMIMQNKESNHLMQPEKFAKRRVEKKKSKPTSHNISEMLVVGIPREDESQMNGSISSTKPFMLPKLAKLPDTFSKGKAKSMLHTEELSKMVKFSEAERILGVQLKRPRLEHEDRKFVREITNKVKIGESVDQEEIKETTSILPPIETHKGIDRTNSESEAINGSRTTSASTLKLREYKMPAPVTKIIFENQHTILKRLENTSINKMNHRKSNKTKREKKIQNVIPTAYKREHRVIGNSAKPTKPVGSVLLDIRSDLNTKFPDYINFQNSRTGGQSRILLSLKHRQHIASMAEVNLTQPYATTNIRNSAMSIRGASSTSWFDPVSGVPLYHGPKPTPVTKFRKLGNVQIYLNDSEY